MPGYTVAVRNVAPRKFMQAATASTSFFRQIGSTLGVAIFGSVLLANQHRDFSSGVPAGIPPIALLPFSNLLMLTRIRPAARSRFWQISGGTALVQILFADVCTLSQAP